MKPPKELRTPGWKKLPPEERLRLSTWATCPGKKRFTMEEAAEPHRFATTMGRSGMSLYICDRCGYLHFGHVPEYTKEKS